MGKGISLIVFLMILIFKIMEAFSKEKEGYDVRKKEKKNRRERDTSKNSTISKIIQEKN
jgi:energy-converting hydrogenase Eha subunit H